MTTIATLLPVGAPWLPPSSGALRGRHAGPQDLPARRPGRGARWVRRISRVPLALALVLMLLTVVMALLGYRYVVISSGSMTPGLRVGDLVVSRSAHPAQTGPGDIVTFHDPGLDGRLVTHRVVSRTFQDDGSVAFTTKGDANNVAEHWSVRGSDQIGLATGQVRAVGWWFLLLHTGIGRVALVLLVCAWIATECAVRIWSRT